MSIRDIYVGLGIDLAGITDTQLESIGMDLWAEFGSEIEPSVDQIREVVERHRLVPVAFDPYHPSIELHALLDFEALGILPRQRKVCEIRDRFGVTETRYIQLLNRALDEPEAMLYAPALVARLTRIRDRRREARWGSAVSA